VNIFLVKKLNENTVNRLWFAVVLVYLAVIGGLVIQKYTAQASGSVTVCASGCDYTNITNAVADASLSSGGIVQVQATYDPTSEPLYPFAQISQPTRTQ